MLCCFRVSVQVRFYVVGKIGGPFFAHTRPVWHSNRPMLHCSLYKITEWFLWSLLSCHCPLLFWLDKGYIWCSKSRCSDGRSRDLNNTFWLVYFILHDVLDHQLQRGLQTVIGSFMPGHNGFKHLFSHSLPDEKLDAGNCVEHEELVTRQSRERAMSQVCWLFFANYGTRMAWNVSSRCGLRSVGAVAHFWAQCSSSKACQLCVCVLRLQQSRWSGYSTTEMVQVHQIRVVLQLSMLFGWLWKLLESLGLWALQIIKVLSMFSFDLEAF